MADPDVRVGGVARLGAVPRPEAPPPRSFARRLARSRGFRLGRPHGFAIAPDGSRVVFVRSPAGDDPVASLWVLDLLSGTERLVADARALGGEAGPVPADERARRDRAREVSAGIVAFASDAACRVATFSLEGRLFAADLVEGGAREVPTGGGEAAVDPRPDPQGRKVAYVTGGALRVVDLESGEDRLLAADDDPDVSYGLAEFVAAEEMGRFRGFWWSPGAEALLAARVDERPVLRRFLQDPSAPEAEPRAIRYPAAGTANADVSLLVLDLVGGRVEVGWDRTAFPYLARASWSTGHPPTLLVQSRDQRTVRLLAADPGTGETAVLREDRDEAWVELVPGSPAWLDDGRPVTTVDDADTRRLAFDGVPVTPPGLQVRRIVAAGPDAVVAASEDPLEAHLWRVSPGGGIMRLTEGPGVHDGEAAGDVVVVVSAVEGEDHVRTRVLAGGREVAEIRSNAERPEIVVNRTRLLLGRRELRAALMLPAGFDPGPGERLPVLLDPYGGPHFQKVVRGPLANLESQWFADQGFAVLVADGRGTPGRGTAFERAVRGDLATPVLEDQVEALEAAAGRFPFLDRSRVAIRGWSFGGFLAALAVLRRPDVFHAAIAGAPVVDQRLYDTHYTERYLGDPNEDPLTYERSSLLTDAPGLARPLLLIHGLVDDNVVPAHSLRLSAALLAAGRPHEFLPLPGATHSPSDPAVAEGLLLAQLDFLRRALGLPRPAPGARTAARRA